MSESEEDFERTMIIPPPGARGVGNSPPAFGAKDAGADRLEETVVMHPTGMRKGPDAASAAAPKVDFDVTHGGKAASPAAAKPSSVAPKAAPAAQGGHGLYLVIAVLVAVIAALVLFR